MPLILIPDILFRKSFDIAAITAHFFPDCQLLLGCSSFSFFERVNAKICCKGIPVRLRSNEEKNFLEDLDNLSSRFASEKIVFIPGEEKTVRFFLKYVQKHPGQEVFCSILSDENIFETLCNKKKLAEFCKKKCIASPHFYSIESLESLPLSSYPLLLKPCSGGGSRGIFRLHSPNDITQEVLDALKKEPYLLQELLPNGNHVEGAFFLCREGKFFQGYTHRRLLTNPPQGGVSVLSEYTENDKLLVTGRKLLETAGWNGLAMVEYLFDPRDAAYKVIEVNPRIWGSILLSEYSGAHLLVNYINFCLNRAPKVCPIRKPAYIRWFFPVDILNVLKRNRPVSWFCFDNTCFINWTYASKWRAIWFNFQSLFSLKNFKRFFR